MSLKDGILPIRVTTITGRKGLAIDQTVAPQPTVEIDVWRTMAHELGHVFGLGDEYVELLDAYTQPESALAIYGNLTTEAAVKNSMGDFSSSLIKWNWRRARKAAVVREPIVSSPGWAPTSRSRSFLVKRSSSLPATRSGCGCGTWKGRLERDPPRVL